MPSAFQGNSFQPNAFQGGLVPAGGSPDVTIALTGISVATSSGTLGVQESIAAVGQIATSSQGTLGVKFDVANIGQVSATAQGTLGLKQDKALTGQVAATAQGTLGVDAKLDVTGQSAGTAQGTLGIKSDLVVSGQQMTSSQGTITADISGDLTIALVGYEVTTQQGFFGVGKEEITGHSGGDDAPWRQEKKKKNVKDEFATDKEARKQALIAAYKGLLEPETPETVAIEAKTVVQSDKLESIDLVKVQTLLAMWQAELDRREEQDDEESLLMLL